MSTSPGITPFPVAKGSRRKARKPGPATAFSSELVASAERQPRKPVRRVRKAAVAVPEPQKSPARLGVPRKIAETARALLRGWSWLGRKYALSATRNLRVMETVSLGEKRFAAVLQVDGKRFLIGGGAHSVSVLTQLSDAADSA